MHYLKCNHCGHLNEVKSEFMVFCIQCEKKIENHFKDWVKKHPDKSFSDWQQLICISESEMSATIPVEKKKNKSAKYWLGFAASFAIFYAIGQFGGKSIFDYFLSDETPQNIMEQEWVKSSYGELGLTLETPIRLTKGTLELPDHVKQYIVRFDSYNNLSNKGFKVFANSTLYVSELREVNLQGAADGSVQEMKAQKGVTDFTYEEDKTALGEIPGIIQRGRYKQDGQGINFMNVLYAKDVRLWHVTVGWFEKDELGPAAAERVIRSISVEQTSDKKAI